LDDKSGLRDEPVNRRIKS